jgi:hypothetical protein
VVEVIDELVKLGWRREGARAVHTRTGSRLVVEARELLWLVIDEAADRRVLGIQPVIAPTAVAKAIARLQDELSIESYLHAYGELGDVGDISIVAWEQFAPDWH